MNETTIMIKLPLYQPTQIKKQMYSDMRTEFARLLNQTLFLKKETPSLRATEVDKMLKQDSFLPSTLQQEARKSAISRYQDWKKNQKTKSYPRFKEKQTLHFNNQNWHLRMDNEYLKVGFPTSEKGNLTLEKYVPVQTNEYSSFWVNYLLTGEMDKNNDTYESSYCDIISIKKGNAILYEKKNRWFFAFSITLTRKETDVKTSERVLGVDRGLRMIAAAGCGETGDYKLWNGRQVGHIRRKYYRLRRALQQAKNTKALKRLENKEQRILTYWNHVISKEIVQFAEQIGATSIALENLSGIRRMKKYWKRSDLNIHSWAFYDLESKIRYKASLRGITVYSVDPYKTSQECFNCGKTKKSNRRQSMYTCSCGHKQHADVNAGFVISTRPPLAV